MRTLQFTALTTAAAAVVFGLVYHFLPGGAQLEVGPHLRYVLPGAASYEKVAGGAYPYYRAAGPGGLIGALFVTTDLAPGVRGYSGPVPVLVGMSPDGRLTGIRILRNNETPSYARRLERPRFSAQFAGKSVNDPFRLDKDVDGVTRATVTATAVTEGVRQASRRAASEIFGLPVAREEDNLPRALRDPAVYGLALLVLASVLFYLGGRRGADLSMLRYVVLAGSLAVIGIYEASPLALVNLFNLTALRLPGIDNAFWYILVSGSLLLAVMWGRVYCGWLCPFGALQEFLSRLPVRKLKVGPGLDGKARGIKYGVLWLVTVAAFVSGMPEIGNFEPYGTLFSGQGGVLAWGLVGVTLGAGIFVPRFWCRYLCPVGAALGLVSGVGLFGRKRLAACDGCGSCAGVCVMGNREGGEAGYSARECIGCNRCIAVCPKAGL